MFNLYSYEWKCRDCKTRVEFVRLGVNSFGELVIRWCCSSCQQEIMVRVPIDTIIKDIPDHPGQEITESDLKYLKELHIAYET